MASMGRKAVDSLFGRKSAKHRSEKPKSLNDYITESNGLVRADKVGEWNDYLRDNTSTPYAAGIIDASLRVMVALSKSNNYEMAMEAAGNIPLTSWQDLVPIVCYFSDKGKKLYRYILSSSTAVQ